MAEYTLLKDDAVDTLRQIKEGTDASAGTAQAAATSAGEDADRSEEYAGVAQGASRIRLTPQAGVTGADAVADGETFIVVSESGGEVWGQVYLNDGGTPTPIGGEYPSVAGINAKIESVDGQPHMVLEDPDGHVIVAVSSRGLIYLSGTDDAVQDVMDRVLADDSSKALELRDALGVVGVSVTRAGTVVANDFAERGGARLSQISARLDGIVESRDDATRASELARNLQIDRSAVYPTDGAFYPNTIMMAKDIPGDTYTSTFAPSISRISATEYLVFCEGRKQKSTDFGETDMLCRKVTVDPETFALTLGDIQVIAPAEIIDGVTYSRLNACSVYLNKGPNAGRTIIYYIVRNTDESGDYPAMKYTDDGGVTWSAEVDLSEFFPMADWKILAPGPGNAIQLQSGPAEGRIVIPSWHGDQDYPGSLGGLRSVIIYSDDGGETYQIGPTSGLSQSNECQIAETGDGRLIWMMRRENSQQKWRAYLDEAGENILSEGSFTNPDGSFVFETEKVQGAAYQAANIFDGAATKLMFSMPVTQNRHAMRVYASYDTGATAPHQFTLTPDPVSYCILSGVDLAHGVCVYVHNFSGDVGLSFDIFSLKSLI